MTATTEPPRRIVTLDAVRGFAVCGILLMNIVAMGLPTFAYLDPTFYGTEGPADWAAWGINYIFSDGKMRALFTMLFGASMVLIAERAEVQGESAAEIHYRRLFWLFIFGMIHAWLIWFGDILVQYAIGGAIAYFIWRWPPRALWLVFAAMMVMQLAQSWENHVAALATMGAPLDKAAVAAREIALYRQGFEGAFKARAEMTAYFQTVLIPQSLSETIGFIALGIILYRNGFLTGAWDRARYLRTMMLGYLVAAPLHLPLIWLLVENDFSAPVAPLAEGGGLLLRPFMALAHAAAIILLVQAGALRWLSVRLAAAGRMAFSNYLGTSLVTTTFFYGYGLSLFGSFSRAELYLVVLGVWAAILLWSKPWLDRYRYGPLEWLWRSLARGRVQPLRRKGALPAGAGGL
jgi:uncharacterized protein